MKPALIVIDAQKFFLNRETQPIVGKIQKFLKKNSGRYQKIYFTVFRNNARAPLWQISGWRGCAKPPAAEICDGLKPFANKTNLFYKNILSAVKVPAIKRGLANVKEVHLCGFDTDCCILATAYDLFDQNIKPVILANLTWSTSKEKLHRSALQMVKRNIGFVKNV